jgi:hypothetical protein
MTPGMTYRPVPTVLSGPAEVVGDLLVVPAGAMLPEICLVCGAHGPGVELRTGPREVGWMPSILVAAWFLNPVFGLLAVALLRKRSHVVHSLCLACTRRRLDAFALHRAIYIGALFTALATLIALLNEHPLLAVGFAFGGGLAGWLFFRQVVAKRMLDVAWIHDDGTVAFRGVAPAAMDACTTATIARPA